MDDRILVQTLSVGTPMDILKMLRDLYAERSHLDQAIGTLTRLSTGQPKRRGRPPKWMTDIRNGTPSLTDGPKRRTFSPESRKRMAAAQRKRWAAVKKAEAQS